MIITQIIFDLTHGQLNGHILSGMKIGNNDHMLFCFRVTQNNFIKITVIQRFSNHINLTFIPIFMLYFF